MGGGAELTGGRGLGTLGEERAAALYRRAGYHIVARNYRSPYGEIDLIARDGQYICFVEVKTRRTQGDFDGLAAVTPAKKRKIILTATLYLQQNPSDLQPRFDVLSLVLGGRGAGSHTWITGAFDSDAI